MTAGREQVRSSVVAQHSDGASSSSAGPRANRDDLGRSEAVEEVVDDRPSLAAYSALSAARIRICGVLMTETVAGSITAAPKLTVTATSVAAEPLTPARSIGADSIPTRSASASSAVCSRVAPAAITANSSPP